MREVIVRLRDQRARGQHPGLILARYLAEQNDEGRDKRDLLAAACTAARDPSLLALYRRAFDRWCKGLGRIRDEADLRTPARTRLIVGLGNKGVVDAGLRLHHTYGVPLIPGSALKGLAEHYCHEVYGAAEERYRRGSEYHNLLFGITDYGGALRFEDAWMHPDSLEGQDQGVLPDVMTPHHQKWQTDEKFAPTDFDSPVSVPFLSVVGCFSVVVCWQGPEHTQARAWTTRTFEILKAALADWGVGGKTSSGYGRLLNANSATKPACAGNGTKILVPLAPTKRASGTPARVQIVSPRPKGGFDVQEPGRSQGTLTLGTPPLEISTVEGEEVNVQVHVDDPKRPQYKWPPAPRK